MWIKCSITVAVLLKIVCSTEEEDELGSSDPANSFTDLYERGVQSYLSNEFDDCVYFLEFALDKYRHYYETTANCRIECDYESRNIKNKGDFLHQNDVENLSFYELILKRTLCLTKCRKRNANYLPFEGDFDNYYMDIFKNREAYSYLHVCYTKTNQMTLAASAALTYMVKHPGDEMMKKNFELAIEKPGVDKEAIVDLEEKKFVKLFVAGILAINDKEWENVISFLESSVIQFIYDENQCRAYCEGEFDHGFIPDFVSAIGNHFTNVLYCKRNCTREMGMVRGKYYYNLFAGHYQYLQMAYYEAGKFEESYRSGISFLLFNKDDVDMLNNLKMIEKESKGRMNENFFKVRREANEYYNRNVYEDKLASFIKTEFGKLSVSEEGVTDELPVDEQLDEILTETDADGADDEKSEINQRTIEEDMIYQTPSAGYQREEL
ncbi:cartilage-associated protein [Aedes albopictus]|uniref:Leprecan-like alpha-helical domain-containing protein n=1 Tax=Aedes albopictus TaxID=7160 RepID=A0ABM1ZGG9_AEDAL